MTPLRAFIALGATFNECAPQGGKGAEENGQGSARASAGKQRIRAGHFKMKGTVLQVFFYVVVRCVLVQLPLRTDGILGH